MYIYIVLSHTGSMPSKLIRKVTKDYYTHVSISIDSSLTNMYSFGRKYLYTPYPAGFVKENINHGLYKLKKNAFISVYKVYISKKEFKHILQIIKTFEENKNSYFYDYRGALGVYFKKNMFTENGYVCSSFVNEVLNQIGIATNKRDWEIRPQDFSSLNRCQLIYEGYSSLYNKSLAQTIKLAH